MVAKTGVMETAVKDFFPWLVNYYAHVVLPDCLKYIQNGVMIGTDGKKRAEGSDKNVPYDGFLIISNGDTLSQRLEEDEVIHDKPSNHSYVRNIEDLTMYLTRNEDEDGAYIYDSVHQQMMMVKEINNKPKLLPLSFNLAKTVPEDFFHYNGTGGLDTMGTKTRLAAKLPAAYDHTHAFQLKRSRYGPLGMGKVTHFTPEGLAKEFFFRCDPSQGPYFNEEHHIVGVQRTYIRENDLLKRVDETRLHPDKLL